MSSYRRWQLPVVQNALKTRRIVIIAGARQVGKTSLAKELMTSDTEYRTLDDKRLLTIAKDDPHEFVKHQHACMIIDEVQKAVELLPAMKMVVDNDQRMGQFLLTGSANIQLLPSVTESLAGRIRPVSLRPLAQGEILSHHPNFLKHVFSQNMHALAVKNISRDDIIDIALRGGYPEPLSFSSYERQLWHQNYIEALLDRDLREIVHIRRQDAMIQLTQVVAAWSTKPIDISAIGSNLSLQRNTLETYFNALEALYLIERIPAYAKTDYDRVGKQSKLIMNDSGLMASLLYWKADDIRLDSDRAGKLIETHVGNELQKHIDHTEQRCHLSHYRDKNKREIDFLIEDDNGDLVGIEVKAGTSSDTHDFKHLKWFKENLTPPGKKFTGIVLNTGGIIGSHGNNMWTVPISTLY
jgi:predicted AAA+ superfamily ATPase